MTRTGFDVLIVGSGPAGLSCAIEARTAGLSAVILEKGSVVDYLRRFPVNLIWFSTPELLEIGGIPFVIGTTRPTRVDAVNYYQRVCDHYKLDVRSFDAVRTIDRTEGTFDVITEKGKVYRARTVVVATGYFDHPNRLGVPGEELPKVLHRYDEPFRYFATDVAVVGGRNSAVEAALDLYRHGVRVTLIHRGTELSKGVKYWILPDIENRIRAGEIRALFRAQVKEITPDSLEVSTTSGDESIRNDFTFVLIGFQPDEEQLKRFGIQVDPESLVPEHDDSTFETNVPGLYVAGSVVAGKNNNKIFVENGRLHGREIVRSILSRKG